ncbi:hypothetical protein CTheo_5987 [Ceratobasidium theobromae]|uniref:Uncharacterized protein n=1 Tax=Ceratobasidium theobromae TaxID=1582974 RepID=A0A5N5QFN5_9AGAM|nr:hypothetical protein CTheo_5987 [Ceratobasidium theobromae]
MTTTSTIYTPLLSSRQYPLSCSEIAHILLTAFSKPSGESRYLVSLVLQSIHNYFEEEDQPLIEEKHLEAVACVSDSLMALATRLEVNLKNEAWTGNSVKDVEMMYTRVVFKLTDFLLDTTAGDPRAAVVAVRATLEDARRYLSISDTRMVQRDISFTASKFGISYPKVATIEDDELEMAKGLQGPMIYEGKFVKMKLGFKSILKGKKWGKKGAEGRAETGRVGEKEKGVEAGGNLVSGGVSENESGVGEAEDEWVFGEGKVVGSDSFLEMSALVLSLMDLGRSMPRL